MAIPDIESQQGSLASIPIPVRVVCVGLYYDEKTKVAGWKPADDIGAKISLPSDFLRPGEDVRQAASRIWQDFSTMCDWSSRPNIWHLWTSRAAKSGELLIFARRKSTFASSLVPELWKNGTPVIPVRADTELDIPEMASGIKACFRLPHLRNPVSAENPDLDANEEFEEQEAHDAQARAEKVQNTNR